MRMKRMLPLLAVATCEVALSCAALAEDTPSAEDVKAIEKQVSDAERALREAREDCQRLEARKTMLVTTDDLLCGRRASVPVTTVTEREVLRLLKDDWIEIDNRDSGKPLIHRRFLDLKPGHRYRLRGDYALYELKGERAWGTIFRCYVATRGGGGGWPGAATWFTPFPRKTLMFDFDVPEDSTVEFQVGIHVGKGRVAYGDIRVSELTEVTK